MKKTSISMVSLAVVLLTFCVTATASQLFDKKTTITINQPMEIPGTPAIVLPPGTYVLKLLNSAKSRSSDYHRTARRRLQKSEFASVWLFPTSEASD
jgi:hypothetical protein